MAEPAPANVDVQVEQAVVELKNALPGINMPDHAVRQKVWFQLYVRLARPTLDWVGVVGAAYALFLGHWIGKPMPETYAGLTLLFVGALYGIRTFEKKAGVA